MPGQVAAAGAVHAPAAARPAEPENESVTTAAARHSEERTASTLSGGDTAGWQHTGAPQGAAPAAGGASPLSRSGVPLSTLPLSLRPLSTSLEGCCAAAAAAAAAAVFACRADSATSCRCASRSCCCSDCTVSCWAAGSPAAGAAAASAGPAAAAPAAAANRLSCTAAGADSRGAAKALGRGADGARSATGRLRRRLSCSARLESAAWRCPGCCCCCWLRTEAASEGRTPCRGRRSGTQRPVSHNWALLAQTGLLAHSRPTQPKMDVPARTRGCAAAPGCGPPARCVQRAWSRSRWRPPALKQTTELAEEMCLCGRQKPGQRAWSRSRWRPPAQGRQPAKRVSCVADRRLCGRRHGCRCETKS